MYSIAEHDGKEKWKRYNRIRRWVHFPVIGHSICIDQDLKGIREFICSVESRWSLLGANPIKD